MLSRLRVATHTRVLPDDVAAWLEEGIDCLTSGGSLDRGLGFKAPGVRAFENQQSVKLRNYWLTQAAQHVSDDPKLSPWGRAGRLSQVINHHKASPRTDTMLGHALSQAIDYHPGDIDQFPSSQRQLHRLLT
ncbi:MAG: hypothetical protein KUF80_06340 [Candidatus Thiodiazotropha sp. (ex Codakia orbicularis)]|nr:hypothetical protein [Candidatus Thiodiazotropha sp. (ex Codakia orbicularis)]